MVEEERFWTDTDTNKKHALHEGENYMIKHMGFCSVCNHSLVQYCRLITPNKKEWLEANCQICNPKDFYPYTLGGKKE